MRKDKNGRQWASLKNAEVALVHCNLVNNNFQQKLRYLYLVAQNKSFAQLW